MANLASTCVLWCLSVLLVLCFCCVHTTASEGFCTGDTAATCEEGPMPDWTFSERFHYGIWLKDQDEGLAYKSHRELGIRYDHCDLERMPLAELTKEVFLKQKKPFIITGGVEALQWAAQEKWQSFTALKDAHGELQLQYKGEEMQFGEVLDLFERIRVQGAGVSLLATHALVNANLSYDPGVISDYSPKPPVLDDGNVFPQIIKAMNSIHRWRDVFSFSYLVVGCEGGGTSFHKDGWDSDFWNAAVKGSKHWLLMAPSFVSKAKNKDDMLFDFSEMTNHDFIHQVYPYMRDHVDVFECAQEEGDILWSPGGWYHSTINTAPEVISITENQVSARSVNRVFSQICDRDLRPWQEQEEVTFDEATHATSLGTSLYMCVALHVAAPELFAHSCCATDQYAEHMNQEKFPKLASQEMAGNVLAAEVPPLPTLLAEVLQTGALDETLGLQNEQTEQTALSDKEEVLRAYAAPLSNAEYYNLLLQAASKRPVENWQLNEDLVVQ